MTHQQQTAFENIVGKEEIAHNEQFLLFQQCFQFYLIIVYPFVHIFDIISLFAAELEEPKIGRTGKGIKLYCLVKYSQGKTLSLIECYKIYTVKPVLETTSIKRPPASRDRCSDIITYWKSIVEWWYTPGRDKQSARTGGHTLFES